jgi:2-C-methyl-D-erythritol 2,4-cyclodiphosphate synthase
MRIGQGFDVHALASGRRLILGGVEIPHDRGLAGHSDGDALLHAVADALLGAAALGDLGGMFPSSDERWRDADSRELLRLVAARVREAGLTVVNIDATVVAREPRLAPYIDAIRAQVAASTGIDITAVSVKPKAADGVGAIGRGDGIAAFAVALIE